MLETTVSGLTLHICGGEQRDGSGEGPLVVLFHGFGAPGTDLVSLWRELDVPRSVRFAFPEGPLDLGALGMPGARAWWPIDTLALERAIQNGELRDLSQSVPEGMAEAHGRSAQMLAELCEQHGVPPGQLVLGGFSQGAMLACDLALREEPAIAGLILMSGTLLCESEWQPLMKRRAGLPVFQSHGRADPLLPFALAERLRDQLSQAGLDVEFAAFNGGHTITPGVVEGVARLIQRCFGDEP